MRRMAAPWICGIGLLLAGTGMRAQSAPPAPLRPAYKAAASGYRIAGTVVNSATGEPVRRATVSLLSEEFRNTVALVETDSEGRFALAGLAAAKYPLTVSKRGFLTAFYDEHDGFSTAIVTGADQDTSGIVFRLTPGASLHGVVTGDGGDPVEGAEVMLFLKPRHPGSGARITGAGETRTDDTGAYEFDGLAPGEYLVAVTAKPWYALHRSASEARQRTESGPGVALDVAYPVTFFDSTTDESSASSILLTGGNREEVNVNLRAVPALHLTVPGPDKEDGPRAFTQLRQTIFGATAPSGPFDPPIMRSTENGDAEFYGVAPGHYEMTQGNPPRVMEFDATSSQQIDPSLGTPSVSVSGTVRTASGGALPSRLTMVLSPQDIALPAGRIFTESSQGSFQFHPVQPGRWELLAWSGDAAGQGRLMTVVSTTANGSTHAGDLLTVRDKPLTLSVILSDSETRIEGFVRKSGKGQAGVMVVLVPKDPAVFRALTRIDQSDSDGSFSLRDVAPGGYTVVAIENDWEMDRSRPEAFQRYLSQGIAVTVTESSGKLVKLSEGVPVESR
jgi:hypothetical protein